MKNKNLTDWIIKDLYDKDGNLIEVGEKVKDIHGNESELVLVSGTKMVKSYKDGVNRFVPICKIVSSEIERVCS